MLARGGRARGQAAGGLRGGVGRSASRGRGAAAHSCSSACRSYMVPSAFVILAGAAADRERQGGPPGACRRLRPERLAATAGAEPRTPARGAAGGDLRRGAGAGAGRGRATTSSTSAGTRCWPRSWCRGSARSFGWSCRCAASSRRPRSRRWRATDRRRPAPRRHGLRRPIQPVAARRPGLPALLRAAAALVPRPARAGQPGVQHAAGSPPDRRARVAGCWSGSFSEIVRRHEALRTTFASGGSGSRCRWSPHRSRSALPLVDLSGLPEDRREAQARALARERSPAPVRPRRRAAAAPGPAAPGRDGARAAR